MMKLQDLMKSLNNPSALNKLSLKWMEEYKAYIFKKGVDYISQCGDDDLIFIFDTYEEELLAEWFLNPLVSNKLLTSQGDKEATVFLGSRFLEVLHYKGGLHFPTFKSEYPQTVHTIPLNAGDDVMFQGMDEQYGILKSPSEIEVIINKLGTSLAMLKSKHSDAYEFITCCNLMLVLRDDSSNELSYSSGSYDGYPGLTLLANAQQERISEARIIDSLYHEAIHTMIYMYEEVNGKLLKQSYDREIKLTSPWSGASLGLNQFAQAIFVWKGLMYLNDALEVSGLNYTSSNAKKGFANNPSQMFLKEGGYEHASPNTIELFEGFSIL
ncbi:hypothetical protein L8R98_00185 [Vibrio splendidus]|uniref:hypothetical protein n=1 Tax=Vibrio splendidus TaxID=29497 RepID=UPI002468E2B4|nr:hypothetical protein [Vibrio splendidus]MDH5975186.1 hypothetical protein [Vibrio splendidus]